MSYERYPRYVSVGEKRAKAEKTLKRLKKDGQIHPIVVKGNAIAKTWWGKAWNDNLERYADYANRIGRGRSYVRHGAVLDLRIEPGKVTGLVQGSRSAPYKVSIEIHALAERTWKEITTACAGSLDSLQDLLAGKFPRALSDVFIARDKGLFPSPKEIKFSCSCPDWARMCKHVAAMLYGIGARLDEDPALFFKLRKVNVDDLISLAVKETAGALLKKAQKKTGRVIAEADLGDVFGIVMEDAPDFGKQQPSSPDASRIVSGNSPRAEKKPVKESKQASIPADSTALVLGIVKKSKTGVNVAAIKEKTGVDPVKIRNILYAAAKNNIIEKVSRGYYKGITSPKNAVDSPKIFSANASKLILDIIKKHKKGIGVPVLKEKSKMADQKIRNILFRLVKQGAIASAARGVYKAN
jgi:uncharacterized Zn finger protein